MQQKKTKVGAKKAKNGIKVIVKIEIAVQKSKKWLKMAFSGTLNVHVKKIMTEVSRNLRNIFFRKIPPILKLEVGFFSDRKSFSQIFQSTEDLYAVNFI